MVIEKKEKLAHDKKRKRKYRDDRMKALLVLAGIGEADVNGQSVPGQCASEEAIAALVEGKLDKKNRKSLLEHIDACPSCYQLWLEVSQAHNLRQNKGIGCNNNK